LTAQCPEFSEVAIITDDAHLAAKLVSVLAVRGKYLPILEQPRLTRPDREGEVIRCTNALARSGAKRFIFAGIGDITSAALSADIPEQKTIHVRTESDIASIPLQLKNLDKEPLLWGKDRIGIGLLKALRGGRPIIFSKDSSPTESIRPKNDHLVVCEEGNELAQVIAANFAFAIGAGLHLIPKIAKERAGEILEQFYSIYDKRNQSVSAVLADLRQELRELAGPIPVPRGGSITFITDELPLGVAFQEVPSTHLFAYPDIGIAIVHGLIAGQSNGPGTRVATFVDPQTTPSPEINAAIKSLHPYGIYLRKYEGQAADVTSITEMIELFPYDLLLIATHCADVSGYRWTYKFEDVEGYMRTLVVDIALGIGRTNVKEMLNVTQFMRFVSLDGVDWNNPSEKEKLYVGKAISSFTEQLHGETKLEPIKKDTVLRVMGSAALAMADGNLIALPRSVAHENTPVVINNACVSWHRLAGNFMFGGASGYIGTLIPVTPVEAAAVVERLLGKHFGKPLPIALWAAQRDVYGSAGRSPYVMMGVFPQCLQTSRVNAPQYIMEQLARGLVTWRRMLANSQAEDRIKTGALKNHVRYYERELRGYQERWLPKRSGR
jgi:hypothetical protein